MHIAAGYKAYEQKSNFSLPKAIELAKRDGFDAFEINIVLNPLEYYNRFIRDIRKIEGMRLVVHADYLDTNLASGNIGIRRESVNQLREAIAFSKKINSEIVVFHPGRFFKKIYEAEAYSSLFKSLDEVIPFAKRNRVKLAVENMEDAQNMMCVKLDDLKRVLYRYDDIYLTFDVTHAAKNSTENYMIIYNTFKNRVIHFHIAGVQKRKSPEEVPLAQSEVDFSGFIKRINDRDAVLRLESADYQDLINSFKFVKRVIKEGDSKDSREDRKEDSREEGREQDGEGLL